MKTLIKLVAVLCAALLFMGLGAYLAVGPLRGIMPFNPDNSKQESRVAEVVESLTREQQVVLLSLGIEGTEERTSRNEKFYGLFEVPGSSRSKLVKYAFTAKLGIEGGQVKIKETGENEYLVTLPKFIFLGHDDVVLSLASEKNGALSWTSPKLDDLEMATSILGDESRSEYLQDYEEILKDQAVTYYSHIVSSLDSDVKLEFEYTE